MRKKWTVALVVCVAFALGGLYASPRSAHSAPKKPDFDQKEMKELRQFGKKFGKLFRYTAASVSPSVVWIEAEKTIEVERQRRNPLFNDPFFRRFFGPHLREKDEPKKREYKKRGLGSGFIIDKEGHIVTNNHVVAEADRLTVKLSNGEEYKATVSGVDPSTELAVIQMEGDFGDLPVVEMGNSDELNVGEWVVAIGNPLGLSQTVSAGIVSAKGRSIGIAKYENLIQTDAAINPGNSGGPLVNLQGEVVGINTAIVSRTGGYMGIGLAIPINMAKPILEDLKAGRTVERGFLGIVGEDLKPDLAKKFGYEGGGGAIVNEVIEDTPAEKAGLQAGDIIVAWKGTPVKSFSQLRRLVAKTEPNRKVSFTIWRNGEKKKMTVKLTRLSEHQATGKPLWIGIKVGPVTEKAKQYYGRKDLSGVMVKDVDESGPADVLQTGDVILRVGKDRQPVNSVEAFRRYISHIDEGESALLLVLRKKTKHAQFVLVPHR